MTDKIKSAEDSLESLRDYIEWVTGRKLSDAQAAVLEVAHRLYGLPEPERMHTIRRMFRNG